MTKKMINADDLLQFLKIATEINKDAGFLGFAEALKFHRNNALDFIEQRINELATFAESQESNFDADGAIAENQNFYKADCWRPLPTPPKDKS